jgi:hypothetical protein
LRILMLTLASLLLASGSAVACGCADSEKPGCFVESRCRTGCLAICGSGTCFSDCVDAGSNLQSLLNQAGVNLPLSTLKGWPEAFGDPARIQHLGSVLEKQGKAPTGLAIYMVTAGRSVPVAGFLDGRSIRTLVSAPGQDGVSVALGEDEKRSLAPVIAAIQRPMK